MADETPVKEEKAVEVPAPVREAPRAEPAPRRERRGYRSLFWPTVLIGVGALWLLSNLGVIGAENLLVLLRLWPLFLILIGLDILVGRFSAVLGGLIGLLAVALVIVLVLVGPSMGWAVPDETTIFGWPVRINTGLVDLKHDTFSEPLNGAESADVTLDLSWEPVTVSALPSGADDLLVADLYYTGDIDFSTSGANARRVSLRKDDEFNLGFMSLPENARWDVALNANVPTSLEIDVASGSAQLDLAALNLIDLVVEGGSGSTRLSLPAGTFPAHVDVESGSFTVTASAGADLDLTLDGGSGSLNFTGGDGAQIDLAASGQSGSMSYTFGRDSDVEMRLDGGSGSITINLPAGAAVRVEVRSSGSGSVNLPAGMRLVDDGGDDDEDTGIWETDGFLSAAHQIVIVADDLASGSFNVR